MKLELVEGWREWWKWASVKLAALASAIVAFLVAMPEAMTYALNVLPPEVRAWLAPVVGMATFALIVATRIFCKPKGGDKNDPA
jgi:hypothetical protein